MTTLLGVEKRTGRGVDNDVHQLIAGLADVVGTGAAETDGLAEAARAVVAHAQPLRDFLSSVITDRTLATRIAGESYWHGNGFAKLILHRHVEPAFHLRLHVWPVGGPDRPMFETGNIHNHRWAFASVVLAGGLHVEDFERTPEFDPDDEKVLLCRRYGYTTDPGSLFGRLRPEGTAALLSVGGNSYGWPERHYGDDERLHFVMPFVGEFTATLVVHGSFRTDKAVVYQPLGRTPLADTGRPLTVDDVIRLVGDTVDNMADRA